MQFEKSIDNRHEIWYPNQAGLRNPACYPGVAQLVACLTGGQEAAGSSPVTRTISKPLGIIQAVFVFRYGAGFVALLAKKCEQKTKKACNFGYVMVE